MAASIPKPGNWQGKIILFDCLAGNIARQVAEEYHKKTNKSVIVVGPKEEITMAPNFLNPSKSPFGFEDPQNAAALKTDSNFVFLKEIRKII